LLRVCAIAMVTGHWLLTDITYRGGLASAAASALFLQRRRKALTAQDPAPAAPAPSARP
jgi:hypothetical protein